MGKLWSYLKKTFIGKSLFSKFKETKVKVKKNQISKFQKVKKKSSCPDPTFFDTFSTFFEPFFFHLFF